MTIEQLQNLVNQRRQEIYRLPRNVHLIQRYSRNTNPHGRQGVSKYVTGDFMGNAHFEYGAMTPVWKALRELGKASLLKIERYEVKPDGNTKMLPVWSIMHVEANVKSWGITLKYLAENDHRLHLEEATYFDRHFNAAPPDWHEGSLAQMQVAWLVMDKTIPLFFTIDKALADQMLAELQISKGVKAEELNLFQDVKFDHHGQTHEGRVVGIYDHHAIINCADSNLKGRQKISYAEIWKT